jgi:hypothetical protein
VVPVKPLTLNTKKDEMARYLLDAYQRIEDEEKALKKVRR